MHACIELAEYRRQDMLADAARQRLAKEARPTRPLASPGMEILGRAVRTLSAAARGALDVVSIRDLPSSSKGEQTLLPLAR